MHTLNAWSVEELKEIFEQADGKFNESEMMEVIKQMRQLRNSDDRLAFKKQIIAKIDAGIDLGTFPASSLDCFSLMIRIMSF